MYPPYMVRVFIILAANCGRRLAAMVEDDADGEKLPTHLTFLLHFFDELRRKAPAK